MKKISLRPENLRVDSFATGAPGGDGRGTVEGRVTGLLHTCPECPNTSVYATCRADEGVAGEAVA
jgi:hypothetical protein